jgi:hypothetical protein
MKNDASLEVKQKSIQVPVPEQNVEKVAAPSIISVPPSILSLVDHLEQKPIDIGAEASFHEHLEELAQKRETSSSAAEAGLVGVIDTVETKLKKALEALVEFVESLQLDQKVKKLVAEFEPSFAKFEARVIQPLNEFGVRASRGLQQEMNSFQVEVNQLKDRLQKRLEELKRESAAPSAPNDETAPRPAQNNADLSSQEEQGAGVFVGHNAMKDLQTLEVMGFTDRRRNLELLATHKGDINAVVNMLLA